MDHVPVNSPSSNTSPSDHMQIAKYRSHSKRDIFDLAGDEDRNPIPSRVPFGEEGTETTQEGSCSGSFRLLHQRTTSANPTGTPSRKASISSREREPPRRNRSAGEKSKSFSNRRKLSRNRSDLARQKQRSDHAKKEDSEKKEGKCVSVEEILALVATTPKVEISRRPVSDRVKRWRSSEQLKGADSADFSDNSGHKPKSSKGTKTGKDSRERSRERSDGSSSRQKSRSRSRRLTRIRKGKRVDAQPDKEISSPEESPRESRRHLKSRRASNK